MTGDSRRLRDHAMQCPGFFPVDEGDALSAVARRAAHLGIGPLLEIGAYQGRSTLFLATGLATALAEGAPATLVLSVDHHRGSEEMQAGWEHHDPRLVDPATGRMDSLPSWRRAIEVAGAEGLVAGVIGDSPGVAAAWSGPLALVLVDGGHGEGPAWADYRGWSPKLARGGFLCFHDVFVDPAEGGQPPYECYQDALSSGRFLEDVAAGHGSLRVLVRDAR
ncbi:MAG: hypothetical protein JWM85_2656 [Acidimicrobiaceae bacterium]|nr:hypothetical protein [Acidimicrobiaceae bacterium]